MMSFEMQLRKRRRLMMLTAVAVALVLGAAWLACTLWPPANGLDRLGEGWPAVLLSAFIGAETVAVMRIVKYSRALKDNEQLEALAITETDEMNRMITLKTCKAFAYALFFLLGLAAMAAAFFSRTVFLTLGFTLIGALVLYAALYIYYSRRF